jgi:outer membrane receptor for ferrienterochelin and colicins
MSKARSSWHAGRTRRSSRLSRVSLPVALLLAWGRIQGAHGAAVTSPEVEDATSLGVLADALDLEELGRIPVESVSTPSRFEQKVTEAPASVSVITEQDFKRFGYRTLADALQGVRGIYMSNDRAYGYVGVRGFSRPSDYNSRVLILVDGHRLNDNVFEGAYVGREFMLDVDMIERVEIVRGPSSSLYGSSAFLGVINVITRKAGNVRNAEVSAEAGSLDSYKGRFSYGGVFEKSEVSLMLSGSFFDSGGDSSLYYPDFDAPETNNGVARRLDGEQALNLWSSLTWRDITLSAAYVSREKDIPTASWDTLFNDPRYTAKDEHAYVDLSLRHAFGEESELMARWYYDDVRYTADYPVLPPVMKDDEGLNRDRGNGQWVGFESQYTHRWLAHVFNVGTAVRGHLNQELENFDVSPRLAYVDEHHESYDVGVHGQADVELIEPLRLNAGVRYDYFESFGGTTNPRLGLIYAPWESTTFKLLYGTAFRAPNVYERFFPLGDLPPDPRLDPETIQTYEAVWEQYLPGNLRFSASGYYYHIDDLISVDDATLLFVNAGEVDAVGAEFEAEWQHRTGVRLRASYAWQRAKDSNLGEPLSNSPENLAKFSARVPFFDDLFSAGVEVQYTGRLRTQAGRLERYADSAWVANLTLFSGRIAENLEVSASLYNLFDTDVSFPGGPGHVQDVLYHDGRTWRVKVTYRF